MGGDTTLLEMSLARLEDIRRRGLEAPASQVVFAHSGAIDHDGVQGLVAVAEQFSLDREDAVSLRKRLVSVIVEGLENVHHHGLSECAQGSFAILLRVGDGYRFAFGNAVLLATAALLTHRVSVLNEMDEADLKEYYLKLLSNDARSERGGAGLGLMTMARKSSGPMATQSVELGNGQAFFSLELYVEPR